MVVSTFLLQLRWVTLLRLHPHSFEVEELWIALGKETDVAEKLAWMNLRFEDGILKCNSWCADQPDILEQIHCMFLIVFKFYDCSTGKWLTRGPSSQALTSSMLIGMDGLLKICHDAPGMSEYYVGAWKRMSPQIG